MSAKWPRCDVDGCQSPAEWSVTIDGKTSLRCAMGIRSVAGEKRRLAITDFPWYQSTPAVGLPSSPTAEVDAKAETVRAGGLRRSREALRGV